MLRNHCSALLYAALHLVYLSTTVSDIANHVHSDWWFASTGIPLLAATLGPLANISSIAALVTSWRSQIYIDGEFVAELVGHPFPDPRWYVHDILAASCSVNSKGMMQSVY
jgi:hypothetical protein